MDEKDIERIKQWPSLDKEEYGAPFSNFEAFFERYKSLDLIDGDALITAKRMWIYYQGAAGGKG